ncbi:MAG: hypothetical protein EGP82_01990 [Odoribacter splanchnicus]|nr:hypothetical protein [Odoribacter splanchnicus]
MNNSITVEQEEVYFNAMQVNVAVVDANIEIVEGGRGVGKTEGVLGPRTMRVAADIPRETSVLAHKSYVALLSNIVPNLIAYYNTPRGKEERPLLREGIDYVVGVKDLPKHFTKPRFPVQHPEHTIFYANGHNIRLVATDQPDAIAGANIVHAFVEEMKHNKGEKLKTRIFPAMRVGRLTQNIGHINKSPYYQGITGVSDSARISLGEDSWFYEYEQQQDPELIEEIVTVSLHVQQALYKIQMGENVASQQKIINKWTPILREMRAGAVHYQRVSTFINKEVLGTKYFSTQKKILAPDEFLTSICAIRERRISNMFFANFKEEVHVFEDGYKYDLIMKCNLKDSFRITSEYLKFYNPDAKLELGFDPGSFASFVVGQDDKKNKFYRILKEFFVYAPQDIPDLARNFNIYFTNRRNRHIDLYYDRAGNQKKNKQKLNLTAAKELKAALESYGWIVRLMNLNQRTIFHWEHYKLNLRLMAEEERNIPRIRIDGNECPNLVSAIQLSPRKETNGDIELDKSSEVKLPINLQAGLSTQIPSGFMYLIFGKFEKYLPAGSGAVPSLPVTIE